MPVVHCKRYQHAVAVFSEEVVNTAFGHVVNVGGVQFVPRKLK